jgi:hypothetical protein
MAGRSVHRLRQTNPASRVQGSNDLGRVRGGTGEPDAASRPVRRVRREGSPGQHHLATSNKDRSTTSPISLRSHPARSSILMSRSVSLQKPILTRCSRNTSRRSPSRRWARQSTNSAVLARLARSSRRCPWRPEAPRHRGHERAPSEVGASRHEAASVRPKATARTMSFAHLRRRKSCRFAPTSWWSGGDSNL